MSVIVREGTNYIIAATLFAACYAGANFLVGYVWGFDAPYSTGRGALRATIETAVQIWAFVFIAWQIERLRPRHRAVPPLLLAVAASAVTALTYYILSQSETLPLPTGWEIASSGVNIAAWLVFSLVVLTMED